MSNTLKDRAFLYVRCKRGDHGFSPPHLLSIMTHTERQTDKQVRTDGALTKKMYRRKQNSQNAMNKSHLCVSWAAI